MAFTLQNPPATPAMAAELGLLPEEYNEIKNILGREPNYTELNVFSVMWSEHCSYKNSIRWLKTLPRTGSKLLVGAGEENAGLVDIGDGLGCAFKIESHNHPSAIEPYQGAATGVGGIHRDIFTMGARPIAALNSLRFGLPTEERTRWLMKGVVKGIGDYGNSFGVPTVGGEVYFNECYHTNPLINAMSVGIIKQDQMISAIAEGAGNPVFIVGSATGKDGIHGATFASADLTDDSPEDLPSVQVGDPFAEKLLLETTLEAIKTGVIVGMQDMGAAGITCSTSEMSAKGKSGMIIWLDKVPTRQKNMQPWEILLSESQERMLVVVKKGKEKIFLDVFEKWDIQCACIGEVTATGRLAYYYYNQKIADIPAESLVLGGGAPIYERIYSEPPYFSIIQRFTIQNIAIPVNIKGVAEQLITLPNIASKKWIWEQYDSMVGINNLSTNSASDAAVVRILGTDKGLAITVDCNSRYIYADPYKGTQMAVSEAARNIVCSGGEPLGITNCLNFGNPYNPYVYWQFVNAIKGMGDACLKFDTPVTSGNVSFYNQNSDDGPVFPTPTIGMVGLLPDINKRMGLGFQTAGHHIYLLGEPRNDISSSEYLVYIIGENPSPCPYFDLEEEYRLQQILAGIIRMRLIASAHDISEGGLFTTLLESAMAGGLGFQVSTDQNFRIDAYLFGESASRVVISVDEKNRHALEIYLATEKIYHTKLGMVTDGLLFVNDENWGHIDLWKEKYDNALAMHFAG